MSATHVHCPSCHYPEVFARAYMRGESLCCPKCGHVLVDLGDAIRAAYRERACGTKVCYGHQQTAITAAAHMYNKTADSYDAYECPFCDGWHIGHSRAKAVAVHHG